MLKYMYSIRIKSYVLSSKRPPTIIASYATRYLAELPAGFSIRRVAPSTRFAVRIAAVVGLEAGIGVIRWSPAV